ncbi:O-methyltransferase [Aspergillus fischeri NRRL 181]|uniref:catechol O-methyltransferase n=1 Tax=Neosartorya fischeri (strain ATCC 1020 / DSM 3700 / CBS 544.65 / FGSC A1164 / JCM 1740 / NRRL 181 / WB 181) TaxID=331117 RepID=A1DNS9_NEOFI|nr:O-methyltransferase, putative [Aspergillus fischeri NRRL 181]EAW16450.1 O-methyltransferase, putative [Aspergillus fischeri NRRL 181]
MVAYNSQSSNTWCEDGREIKLLHFVYGQPNLGEIRGRPQKVLDLIDQFANTCYLMNVGREKGRIITKVIEDIRPQTMIELGGYVGYSAILFGDALRRNGGKRLISLESNPESAAVANMLVELAGLRDLVSIIVGQSDESLHQLYTTGEVKHIELMFIDHYKAAYITDVKLCEHYGMISPGTVLAADNVLFPGNPQYLEYVRSTVEQKRKAGTQNRRREGYDVSGLPEVAVTSMIARDTAPKFSYDGNPNLVYESELHQPEGHCVSSSLLPLS